jgi:hypothetical protein
MAAVVIGCAYLVSDRFLDPEIKTTEPASSGAAVVLADYPSRGSSRSIPLADMAWSSAEVSS